MLSRDSYELPQSLIPEFAMEAAVVCVELMHGIRLLEDWQLWSLDLLQVHQAAAAGCRWHEDVWFWLQTQDEPPRWANWREFNLWWSESRLYDPRKRVALEVLPELVRLADARRARSATMEALAGLEA